MLIYLIYEAQIALLVDKKVPIPNKYLDFVDIFLKMSVAKLFKHSVINKYLINLESKKQSPYCPIYNLGQIELETVKTFI